MVCAVTFRELHRMCKYAHILKCSGLLCVYLVLFWNDLNPLLSNGSSFKMSLSNAIFLMKTMRQHHKNRAQLMSARQ